MTEQPITDQQLDEYDELCAAATPGPWAHTDSSAIVAPLSADKIADVWEPTGLSRNGDFIETARTAMPALIAEVRRLQALVAELEPDAALLAALYAAGVDNWEGYDNAREEADARAELAAAASAAGESGSTR